MTEPARAPREAPPVPAAGVPAARRAWEAVVAWVEERILDGRLRVGAQLPAERDLAGLVGVGRSAVREAARTLQALGVVRASVGAGPAGGTTVTDTPHQALNRLLRLHVALANFPAQDVTEVRVALERLSAASACEHASGPALARIEQSLERMDDDTTDREEFNDLDTAFHVAVAEAAGNRLATDLTIAIRESMRAPILERIRGVEDWDSLRGQLRAEHHAIHDAIAAGDAPRAAELAEQHIRSSWARLPVLHARGAAGRASGHPEGP